MALFRQVSRAPRLVSQCQKLGVVFQTHRGYADMPEMAFTLASPSDVYYKEANVKQIDVPSMSGNFGILPNHVPILAVLKPGILTVIEEGDKAKKFFVSSGTVTVNSDASVQILAEEAHPVERIDGEAVRSGLSKAQNDLTLAPNDKAKAEVQIAIDCYEALQQAIS